MAQSLVAERSFSFAVRVVGLYQTMTSSREYVMAKQLLRSATSIGANIEEATAAQSRKDFAAKMAIASKEARETRYWLRLVKATNIVPVAVDDELAEVDELIRMLSAIVKTAKQNSEQLNP